MIAQKHRFSDSYQSRYHLAPFNFAVAVALMALAQRDLSRKAAYILSPPSGCALKDHRGLSPEEVIKFSPRRDVKSARYMYQVRSFGGLHVLLVLRCNDEADS